MSLMAHGGCDCPDCIAEVNKHFERKWPDRYKMRLTDAANSIAWALDEVAGVEHAKRSLDTAIMFLKLARGSLDYE